MSGPPRLWTDPERRADGHEWLSGAPHPEREQPRPPRPAAPTAELPGGPARPGRRRLLWAGGGAAAAALLAAATLGVADLVGGGDDNRARQATVAPLPAAPPASGRATTPIGKIYARASPAVVSVRAGSATGTGFVIDTKGTLVTNAHVVDGNDRVTVRFGENGRNIDAQVVGRDVSSDLAVLHIDPSAVGTLHPLTFADSDKVHVGDTAIAIGNPFGLDRTATAGIVSGLGRHIQAPNGFEIDKVIQTDAPINPGNSGGPLLDANGRVIGVNSQIATTGVSGNVGVGFAVPSNTVREVVPRLEQGGTIARPYLGIATTDALGGSGAEVAEVKPGTPADKAGLQLGDVIVAIDGRPIRGSDDVSPAIAAHKPGDRVTIDLLRNGDRRRLGVKLGNRP